MAPVGTAPVAPKLTLNDVVVDFGAETLVHRDGRTAVLRPQTFVILRHLAANPNRLVTKGELIDVVWHGAAVTDDSIVQCVHEIRRALSDDRHALLQTVSRRGYRLLIPPRRASVPPRGPSIAVLPFKSMAETAGGTTLAEGLFVELVAGLSKIRGLSVIAYATPLDTSLRDLAVQLDARYLVDGSIRGAGSRLRVTVALIDGASGIHAWTARFDAGDGHMVEEQERLATQIVGEIEPSIRSAEIGRAHRKDGDLDAYDLCLRAIPYALSNIAENGEKALVLLDAALALDPEYLPAHAYAAWCHEQRYLRGGFDPADRKSALSHADRALRVNSDDPQAISIAAFVRANLTRDYDAAIRVMDRALTVNDKSSLTLGFSALVSAHSERCDRAVDHALRALELSPSDDPMNYHPYCALTVAHLFAGRFREAAEYAAATIRANPDFSVAHAYLVTSLVELGDLDAARLAARRLLEVAPTFSVQGFVRMDLFRAQQTEVVAHALRQAGLPNHASGPADT